MLREPSAAAGAMRSAMIAALSEAALVNLIRIIAAQIARGVVPAGRLFAHLPSREIRSTVQSHMREALARGRDLTASAMSPRPSAWRESLDPSIPAFGLPPPSGYGS